MGNRYRRKRTVLRRSGRLAREVADVGGVQGLQERRTLEAVLDATDVGVVTCDRDGRIVTVNAAMSRLLGVEVTPADALRLPAEVVSGERTPSVDGVKILAEVLRQAGIRPDVFLDTVSIASTATDTLDVSDTSNATRVRIHIAHGQDLWLHVACAPIRDDSGAVLGAIAVYREMTDQQQLQREHDETQASVVKLRETVLQLEEFVAVAAHDLRNPLAGALGKLQLSQRRLSRQRAEVDLLYPELAGLWEGVRKGLDDAARSVQHLSQSVGVLLDVARAQSGRLELKLQRNDLIEVMREQVQLQRMAALGRDIQLAIRAEQSVLVEIDAVRVGEVVANFVTNALKYSAAEWPVEVEVRVDGGMARVEVHDNGPGLPPAEQARVWERFYRAPGVRPTSDDGGGAGLGLGLHISKRIIEQHGGTTGVESTLGAGSTFWFTLPLARDAIPVAHAITGAGDAGKRYIV